LTDEEFKESDNDLSRSSRDNSFEYSNWTGKLLVGLVKNKFNKSISLGMHIIFSIDYSFNASNTVAYLLTRVKNTLVSSFNTHR